MAYADPTPWVRIYHKIDSQLPLGYWSGLDPAADVKPLLYEAQQDYPHMANLTWRDYLKYWDNKVDEDMIKENQSMKYYSVTDLWDFLSNHPLRNRTDADEWATFLNNSYFPKVIDLGQLYGRIPLRLAPGNFHFEHFDSVCPPNHKYIDTGVLAVEYQDRHAVTGAQYGSKDDGVLRQFKEVGCILANGLNGWDKTGHVLVIDMGPGRNRHPWIILAEQWDEDDGYLFHQVKVPKSIGKNSPGAKGVFPGNSDRTTIARLIPKPGTPSPTPFLLQFGSDFQFGLDDRGTSAVHRSKGPELARVMPWVWRLDETGLQQRCYSDDFGIRDYLLYDAETGVFIYPEPKSEAT
ncbi:MAG: hypothetical protein Q9215_007868 [Flavoplaca cf. flavocitrina]